jgi:hypothetical protein
MNSRAARQFDTMDADPVCHTRVGFTPPSPCAGTVLTIEISVDLPRIRGKQERLIDLLYAVLFRAEHSAKIGRRTATIGIKTVFIDGKVHLCLSENGFDNLCLGLTECAEIISDHGGSMYSWHPIQGGASYAIILPAV